MAGRQIAAAAGFKGEMIDQLGQKFLGCEVNRPGSDKFNCQGKPIQFTTNLSNSCHSSIIQNYAGFNGPGALYKQVNGAITLLKFAGRYSCASVFKGRWNGQRHYNQAVFSR